MPIIVEGLNFTYNKGTPFAKKALDDINLTIDDGEFFAIIGHTGSGKSTFIQHFNALVKLQQGKIVVNEFDLSQKKVDYKGLRRTVGMVFQYPEHQLFADTVAKDVAFGPKNLGIRPDEIQEAVKSAIEAVGLDYDEVKNRSPFELSGGQKRRVAIAGVIVTKPKILILDEPTSGLDPQGKKEILELVVHLKQTFCPTVIMINHDMNEVAKYATRAAVLNGGKIQTVDTTVKIFENYQQLSQLGLDVPQICKLVNSLNQRGLNIPQCLTVEEATRHIVDAYKRTGAK